MPLLVLNNIPVRKLSPVYIVFWTGSNQSDCPGWRFSTVVKQNLYLKKNPNRKLNKKILKKTKIPLHIEEGQRICEN